MTYLRSPEMLYKQFLILRNTKCCFNYTAPLSYLQVTRAHVALTGKCAGYVVALPHLSCIISLCSCHLVWREFQFFHWFWALKKSKIMLWQRTPIAYFRFLHFSIPMSFLPPSLPSFLLSKKKKKKPNCTSLLRSLNSLNSESSLIQTPLSYLHLGFICSFVVVLAIRRTEEARVLQWCQLRSWDAVASN